MLSELDLVYVVQNEVLKITTPEEAENDATIMVFPVRDFVVSSPQVDAATDAGEGLSDLIELVTMSVSPDTWSDVGGRRPGLWRLTAGGC